MDSAPVVHNLIYRPDPCYWLEQVRSLGYAILLDSAGASVGAANSARRYDIITAAPERVTVIRNGETVVHDLNNHSRTVTVQPVFTLLQAQMAAVNTGASSGQPSDLAFTGGLAGYWGYELNHQLEPERVSARPHQYPDMLVGLYLWAIISDHQNKSCQLYFHPALAEEKKQRITRALEQQPTAVSAAPFLLKSGFENMTSRQQYDEAFYKIQQWIAAGDCYQINLTQRFSADYQGDPWQAYQTLRRVSPTPFSAFLDFPELKVLSHSPERLLLSDRGYIEAKPIKGTRPRGTTSAQDAAQAQELMNSPKDRAENLMIVDLLRNDLGRNCTPGSVRVPVLFGLESYANVHHMVSTITGELAEGRDNLDLLRTSFPGGSVTGAPKIRAMEIIREIEPNARSVYCGAIGYISLNGRMDTNIPIRTLVADQHQIHVWGGGAIVADSECHSEYEESLTKIRNLVQGLERVYLSNKMVAT